MGVPSNLGANSSVIFSIRRFAPQIYASPLTTAQAQTLAYKQIAQEQKAMPKSHTSVLQDFLALGNSVLTPNDDEADYLGGLVARINTQDIPNMTPAERRDFYATEAGQALFREVQDTLGVQEAIQEQETEPTSLETLILQRQQEAVVARTAQEQTDRGLRNAVAQLNAEADPTGIMSPPDSGVYSYSNVSGGGGRADSSQSVGRADSSQSADSDGSFKAPPDSGMPESQDPDDV